MFTVLIGSYVPGTFARTTRVIQHPTATQANIEYWLQRARDTANLWVRVISPEGALVDSWTWGESISEREEHGEPWVRTTETIWPLQGCTSQLVVS